MQCASLYSNSFTHLWPISNIKFSPALTRALQQKHWADFAQMYNGPSYRKNHYDTNLETLYEQATP